MKTKYIRLDVIIIILAILNFFTAQISKNAALKTFKDLDRSFTMIHKITVNIESIYMVPPEFIAKFERQCFFYTQFDEEIFNSFVIIASILEENIRQPGNKNELAKTLMQETSQLQHGIQTKQRELIYCYDTVLYFTAFLLVIAAILTFRQSLYKPSKISTEDLQNKERSELSAKKLIFTSIAIILGTAINIGGAYISRTTSIPLYFDSLTTIAITAGFGLTPGIICAVLTNSVLYIMDYSMIFFVICHILTALTAWLTFEHFKKFHPSKSFSILPFIWAGLWSGITNTGIGNIIASLIYPVESSVPQIDNITYGLYVAFQNMNLALTISGFLTNITDKMFSALFSFIIYKSIYTVIDYYSHKK